jgi:bifunctional UDP-N-acetylglucosamine pyrophosphorylase/glucosamine-1-phosphate N-acetyltransferase
MGTDKAQLRLPGGPTLLEHVVGVVAAAVDEVVVVGRPGASRPQLPDAIAWTVDAGPEHAGPLAGVVAGLTVLASRDVELAYLSGADAVGVSAAHVRWAVGALGETAALLPVENGREHPLAGAVRVGPALEVAAAMLAADVRDLRGLFARLGARTGSAPDRSALAPCNTPAEWDAASERLGRWYRAGMDVRAIVLAAGKGTRMRSNRAKVLHELHGVPLVLWPIRAARAAGVEDVIVVVGHEASAVRAVVEREPGLRARFVLQPEQRGTGDAVRRALPALDGFSGPVLVLSGDVPGLRPATLEAIARAAAASPVGLALASFRPAVPGGYGRLIRARDGALVDIREERDASPTEREIAECNAGVYCVSADRLRRELPFLEPHNAQGELYLTDVVARLARQGRVEVVEVDAAEVAGVNTPEQLAALEQRPVEPPA